MEISTFSNWRVISALAAGLRTFLKSGTSTKTPFPDEQRERRNDLLRLDVQALYARKVDLVVKVSGVANERFFSSTTSCLRQDDLDLDTFTAYLQSAEVATFGKQHTTTRSTERHTDTRFPTIKTRVACVMSSLSEETMMLTLVGAEDDSTYPHHTSTARTLRKCVEWLRDSGVLGLPPVRTVGSLGPCPFLIDAVHAGARGTSWSQVAVGPSEHIGQAVNSACL